MSDRLHPRLISNSFELGLPEGYQPRLQPDYYADTLMEQGVIHQPDVYAYAAALAERLGATRIIDIGCGRAGKLLPLAARFDLLGIDYGPNLEWCLREYPQHRWMTRNFEVDVQLPLPDAFVRDAVVICSDVIEHLIDPLPLVRMLSDMALRSRAVVVSTPDRVLVRGPQDMGPPRNAAHVREWALDELAALFTAHGASPAFAGWTRNNDRDNLKRTNLLTFGRDLQAPTETPPADFQVLAIVCAFNEADIIEATVDHLLQQDCHIHLIDNHSTDGTAASAQRAAARAGLNHRLRVETFPAEATGQYEWQRLLERVELVAAASDASWVMHYDADELRESPWEGATLRQACYAAQQRGYTALDHSVLEFRPTEQSAGAQHFMTAAALHAHLPLCEWGTRPGHFQQVKAWKRHAEATIAEHGGHTLDHPDLRVYPIKMLTRHYPIRGVEHGRRKVLAERMERFNTTERERGWHSHYDELVEHQRFVWDAAQLLTFDTSFAAEQLTERLAGIPRYP